MFGIFKKRIPASEPERQSLVGRLFLHRYESDSSVRLMAEMCGEDPQLTAKNAMSLGFPEATIVGVVEQFYMMKDTGATDEFAVKTLNQSHATTLRAMGREELSLLEGAPSLLQYVRHVVDTLHGHGIGVSDDFLIDSVQEIKQFYRR